MPISLTAWSEEAEASLCKERFLAHNPVLARMRVGALKTEEMKDVFGQYVGLVTMISSYLFAASGRLETLTAVRHELIRNLAEERGSRTGGLTHHEILNRELMKLGIQVNLTQWNTATRRFLLVLGDGIHKEHPLYAAGMIYALEATATPELVIVGHMINEYARVVGIEPIITEVTFAGRATSLTDSGEITLDEFFARHISDFEPGHRKRLLEALVTDLGDSPSPADVERVANGYVHVIALMNEWWDALAVE